MGALKKKKNKDWEEGVKDEDATKTELETSPDAAVQEILKVAQKSEPSLIVLQGENMGQVHRLRDGRNVVGRHPSSDVVLNQRAVSACHAIIRVSDDGSVILEDNKSTNGTFLNSVRINRPMILQPSDLLKVGTFVFKYVDSQLDASFTESLHAQGTTDKLTGVYNKGYITSALSQSVDIARAGYPLSVILLDIDHFKKINDKFGHLVGDHVLQELCQLIRNSGIRAEDMIGRFGGEEFLLILPDSPLRVAVDISERIRKKIEDHKFEFEGKRIPVTSSFGVCDWRENFESASDFLEHVDRLLYHSKENGRNQVSYD